MADRSASVTGVTPDQAKALARRLGFDRIARDVPLAPLTTFRIGGPADLLYRARTAEELAGAVLAAREVALPFFVLGGGANILVGDGGFRGLVIHNASSSIRFFDGGRVSADSGVSVHHALIEATVARGLGGLHHFVGIPGTVGGAIWQNLHFLSPDRQRTVFIEEVVEGCDVVTPGAELRTLDTTGLEFGYDYSILHDIPHVVLSATFRLTPTPEPELRAVMRDNLAWRDQRHPDLWLYPCAGSIFRKVEGIGAGRLIDECGLKGHVHPSGRAMIFHRHANIIVNLGGARSSDIVELMDVARETVASKTGHTLVPEIGLIGEF